MRSWARPRGGGLAAAVAAGLFVYLTAIVAGQSEPRPDLIVGDASPMDPVAPPKQRSFGGGPIIVRNLHVALAPGSPGDDDGFADADETIEMTVSLRNKSGFDLNDVVVGLDSTDPRIA